MHFPRTLFSISTLLFSTMATPVKTVAKKPQASFTGTVVSLQEDVISVKIHRIFQGTGKLAPASTVELLTNLSEISMCPLVNDTRIFFVLLPDSAESRMKIHKQPQMVTLRNLERMHNRIKGLDEENIISAEPKTCETTLCEYGAHCEEPAGVCVCGMRCNGHYAPVCGTDHRTYWSKCHIELEACKRQRWLRVEHGGRCDRRDPCADMNCPKHSICIRQPTGSTAYCKCPLACYKFGDEEGSLPVCGTDGKTYPTECDLHKHACENSKDIDLYAKGPCDPCLKHPCAPTSTCKLGPLRKPECRCSESCPAVANTICASNGKTYINTCAMTVDGCKTDRVLRVVHFGSCESRENPCKKQNCKYGQECEIERDDRAVCRCPPKCPRILKQVCGTDGRTYDNACELKQVGCKREALLEVQHEGPCGKGLCSGRVCPHGAECTEEETGAVCKCPRCHGHMSPVCATDGRTYNNRCEVRRTACELRDDSLHVKYDGVCEACRKITCTGHYEKCVVDGRGGAQCRCNDKCTEEHDPVCGIDGVTFKNECELQLAACKSQKFQMVAKKGTCDGGCQEMECDFGMQCVQGSCRCPQHCPQPDADSVVCGSDFQLYESKCRMLQSACERHTSLHVIARDHCPTTGSDGGTELTPADDGSCNAYTCKFGGFCLDFGHGLECDCHLNCSDASAKQVCGTDGVLYQSICAMNTQSCETQQPIYEDLQSTICRTKKSACDCNRAGSVSPHCYGEKCICHPGVHGDTCDRCYPRYWGLSLKLPGKSEGCLPCACSIFGSDRLDCNQDDGQCVCLPGVTGPKCTICVDSGKELTSQGCVRWEERVEPRNCEQLVCHHGAKCSMQTGKPTCYCEDACADLPHLDDTNLVCGSDGRTYTSECELRREACRLQSDLVSVAIGTCD